MLLIKHLNCWNKSQPLSIISITGQIEYHSWPQGITIYDVQKCAKQGNGRIRFKASLNCCNLWSLKVLPQLPTQQPCYFVYFIIIRQTSVVCTYLLQRMELMELNDCLRASIAFSCFFKRRPFFVRRSLVDQHLDMDLL